MRAPFVAFLALLVVAPAVARAAPESTAEEARAPRGPGYELASVGAGVAAGGRRLRFDGATTPGVRDYTLDATPLVVVHGALFPFADASREVDVGLVGSYARALAVSSAPSGGGAVDTSWTRIVAGGAFRLRLRHLVAVVAGAYADESFAFDGAPIDAAPAVDYRTLRASLDVRVPLGKLALLAGAAYDAVLSAGAVGDRFPRASTYGAEASLGAAYVLGRHVELVAAATYRRFVYVMNPVPHDAVVASGAADELYALEAGVAYAF